MKLFNHFCDSVGRILRYWILTLTVVLFAIVILTVLTREFSGWVFSWSEEVPRYLLIWIGFGSAAAGVDVKDHIAFDYFYERFPGALGTFVKLLVNVGLMAFGCVMLVYGTFFVQDFGSDMMESIPFTNIWYYISLPISGGLIILFALRDFLNVLFAPELRTQRMDFDEAAL